MIYNGPLILNSSSYNNSSVTIAEVILDYFDNVIDSVSGASIISRGVSNSSVRRAAYTIVEMVNGDRVMFAISTATSGSTSSFVDNNNRNLGGNALSASRYFGVPLFARVPSHLTSGFEGTTINLDTGGTIPAGSLLITTTLNINDEGNSPTASNGPGDEAAKGGLYFGTTRIDVAASENNIVAIVDSGFESGVFISGEYIVPYDTSDTATLFQGAWQKPAGSYDNILHDLQCVDVNNEGVRQVITSSNEGIAEQGIIAKEPYPWSPIWVYKSDDPFGTGQNIKGSLDTDLVRQTVTNLPARSFLNNGEWLHTFNGIAIKWDGTPVP